MILSLISVITSFIFIYLILMSFWMAGPGAWIFFLVLAFLVVGYRHYRRRMRMKEMAVQISLIQQQRMAGYRPWWYR